jgi:hypothetical protein
MIRTQWQCLVRSGGRCPELRPILAGRDVVGLYRWLQRQHVWSQFQIGTRPGQSQPEISAILHGRRVHHAGHSAADDLRTRIVTI